MKVMKEAGKKQADIMTDDDVDREELRKTYEDLSRIRSQMGWQKTEELLALKEILNKEQGEELRNMMQRMQKGRDQKDARGDKAKDGKGREERSMDHEEIKKRIEERRRKWDERQENDQMRERQRRATEDEKIEQEQESGARFQM
jgi:hypothetical protein